MAYFDNASTTKVLPEVKKEIINSIDIFGNPSSHSVHGLMSKQIIEKSRAIIAKTINAEPNEIYFTSGATEGNNWIIKGYSKNIITSTIEHHSVLKATRNSNVQLIPAIYDGVININKFNQAVKLYGEIYGSDFLSSVMMVNNEIGTIEPIKYLAKETHANGGAFHTDATQAYGHVVIDVKDLDVDFLTVSGHKFGAPKGIGFVYIKEGLCLDNLLNGGQQERGQRSGTENIPYICGLAKACSIANEKFIFNNEVIYKLYNEIKKRIEKNRRRMHINGGNISNIISLTIDGIDGAELAAYLDANNIYVSTGSACNSDSNEPSHVLKAIGLSDEQCNSTIRISLSPENRLTEVELLFSCIEEYIDFRG